MTEQERADALAEQLDALLAGETPATDVDDDLAELLGLAEQVAATAPAPRPEFGSALKQSLLQGMAGNGAAFGGWLVVLLIAGLVGLLGLIGLIVGVVVVSSRPTPTVNPAPVQAPAQTVEAVVSPTSLPVTATPRPTATNRATDTLPAPSPTAILDILPPVTVTPDATAPLNPPAGLVPGQPSSGSSNDNGSGSGSGSSNDDNDDDDDD